MRTVSLMPFIAAALVGCSAADIHSLNNATGRYLNYDQVNTIAKASQAVAPVAETLGPVHDTGPLPEAGKWSVTGVECPKINATGDVYYLIEKAQNGIPRARVYVIYTRNGAKVNDAAVSVDLERRSDGRLQVRNAKVTDQFDGTNRTYSTIESIELVDPKLRVWTVRSEVGRRHGVCGTIKEEYKDLLPVNAFPSHVPL